MLLLLVALVPLGWALHAPSLELGWYGDDYVHRRFILDHLHGRGTYTEWWNMFDGRAATDRAAEGADPRTLFGRLPWWASPDFSFALLRPLSTASHFTDYLLWPDRPRLMHVHNLVWFGAIAWLAGALYFRLAGGWPAALALAMFVVDDAHILASAWIAGRNTLLTTFFILLTLGLYARGVRGSRPAAWGAVGALACAHASSEGATIAWAYVLAFALWLDDRPRAARLRSLAPLAAVSGVWLTASAALGYGVRGSGIYVDPRHDPVGFARAVATRLPGILEQQLALPPEAWWRVPGLGPELAMYASQAYLGLVVLACVWAARRSRVVAFFATACVLAVLPQCAAGSFGRLLLLSGFAAHGLTACAFAVVWREAARPWRALIGLPWSAALVFVHGFMALEAARGGLQFTRAVHGSVVQAASSLAPGEPARAASILVLNYPDYLRSVFVALYRRELFGFEDARMHVLATTGAPVRLTRTGPHTARLESEAGSLLDPTTLLVRRPLRRFTPGERFALGEITVEIDRVSRDGEPTSVVLETAPRNVRALAWMSWNPAAQRFEPVSWPEIGASRWLGPPRGPPAR